MPLRVAERTTAGISRLKSLIQGQSRRIWNQLTIYDREDDAPFARAGTRSTRSTQRSKYGKSQSSMLQAYSENFMAHFLSVAGRARTEATQYTVHQIEETIYECIDGDDSDLLNVNDLIPIQKGQDQKTDQTVPPRLFRCLGDWRIKLIDKLMLCVIFGTAFVSPLTFIFEGRWSDPDNIPGGLTLVYADLVLDAFYFLYLLLLLNTSFIDPRRKIEIVCRDQILRWRMPSFILGTLSCGVYLVAWLFDTSMTINFIKIVRCRHFVDLPDSLWRLNNSMFLRLFRPGFFLVAGSHWLACLLSAMGGYAEHMRDCGLDCFETSFLGRPVSSKLSQYFMAFVEAIFLLTGSMDNPLGEGSSPRQKNFGSLIVVSIFGPVGCVYVAHIIAIIVLETNLSNYLKIKHEENYALIHRALENLNAPHGLRRRVFSLYRFQQMGHDQEALTSLLDKKNTSSALDSALRLVLYKDSVLHSRYFYAKDPNYILEVLRVLEDHMFLPGDFIIRYGEVGTQMYFVNRGEMKVISSKSVVFHEISHKGDFFGEIALVRDCRRTASVRAESYVICCTLSRQCMLTIWNYYPEAKAELESMIAEAVRDRRNGSQDTSRKSNNMGATLSKSPSALQSALNQPQGAVLIRSPTALQSIDMDGAFDEPLQPSTAPESQKAVQNDDSIVSDGEDDGGETCDELKESVALLCLQVEELLNRQDFLQGKLTNDAAKLAFTIDGGGSHRVLAKQRHTRVKRKIRKVKSNKDVAPPIQDATVGDDVFILDTSSTRAYFPEGIGARCVIVEDARDTRPLQPYKVRGCDFWLFVDDVQKM